jgi:methylated-DNA-protein-cysteine methyltransferase-like protein
MNDAQDTSDFDRDVLAVIHDLRSGEVATYGEIAELAGHPRKARAVGRLLRTTEDDVPWWRVVGHGGRLVSPSPHEQAKRLQREGHQLIGPTGPIRLPAAADKMSPT